PREPAIQHVRAGMAAPQRPQGLVSRGRPRAMVLACAGGAENSFRPARLHPPADAGDREYSGWAEIVGWAKARSSNLHAWAKSCAPCPRGDGTANDFAHPTLFPVVYRRAVHIAASRRRSAFGF